MMTNEELEQLMREISEQIEQLPEDPEKPLSREERKRKVLLQAKNEALSRIKAAKEKGNFNQEVKACMDYGLLAEYGEKNPFLFNYVRSQIRWFGF